jgi:superfamily II DNA/RNA helicase
MFKQFIHLGLQALIVLPTRELANQVADVVKLFASSCGLRYAALYGGASKVNQMAELRRGPHLVIATPGRLLDMMSDLAVSLHNTSYVVLDEADRMLDMGFEPQIRKVMRQVRVSVQLFYSFRN